MVKVHLKYLMTLLILLGLTLSPKLHGQNEVYLKIQSDGYQLIDIVVSVFNSESPIDYNVQIRDIIINDLKLSGFFNVIIEDGFTSSSNSDRSQIQNSGRTNIAAMLEGTLDVRGSSLTLSARLHDLPAKNLIFNKKFNAQVKSMRWLSHQVADEVSYHLIGEYGIACTQVAYVTGDNRAKNLMFIDYDGFGTRQLTKSSTLNLSPRWSPDGVHIAFTSYAAGNPDLMVLQLDKGNIIKLSNQPGLNTAPSWSADGKKIAFTMTCDGNAEIYSKNRNGSNLRRLTIHPAIDSSPSWSPGGREIVFTSDRSGSPQVYMMDSEGGNIRRLTFEGNYNDSPAWSPRGDRIVFVSRIENQFHIFSIDVTGENLRRLTDGNGNNENPSWSHNGLKIAFASNRDGKWDIYIMNWDGSQVRRLTHSGRNTSPSWSPRLVGANE